MKKILTVLAGYAAGLAIAMKVRKDNGNSKIGKNPTAGNLVDEIVDIHKTAYSDLKNFVATTFDEVNDVDSLKKKLTQMADDFGSQIEKATANVRDNAEDYADTAKAYLEDAYAKTKTALKDAEEKIKSFGEDSQDSAKKAIDEAKVAVETKYNETKKKITK